MAMVVSNPTIGSDDGSPGVPVDEESPIVPFLRANLSALDRLVRWTELALQQPLAFLPVAHDFPPA